MKTVFLIDSENIGARCMDFAQRISREKPDSEYVVFFTQNCPRLSLEVMTGNNCVKIKAIHCDCGKEMLDKELMIHLTAMVVGNKSENIRYAIISKDKEFKVTAAMLANIVKGTKIKCYKSLRSFYDIEIVPRISKEKSMFYRMSINLAKSIAQDGLSLL